MNVLESLDVGGPAFYRNSVYGYAPVTMSGAPINEAQATDIASAATIDLDSATGNLVDVTGTTTITAITLSQGLERVVRFTGALTLTNGASLVLPGAANITTAAGDFAVFRGYASGVVRCVVYQKSAVAPVSPATQADQETGTSTTTFVSPGRQQYHPSAAKAWVSIDGTGTVGINASYNVSSITDNATGSYTVNLSTSFSGTNYVVVASNLSAGFGASMRLAAPSALATGSFTILSGNLDASANFTAEDKDPVMAVAFGDQ